MDKSITLAFTSKKEFANFRSALATYKFRYNSLLAELEEDDLFGGKVIIAERISAPKESPLVYKFYLGAPVKREPTFRILSVDEANDSND